MKKQIKSRSKKSSMGAKKIAKTITSQKGGLSTATSAAAGAAIGAAVGGIAGVAMSNPQAKQLAGDIANAVGGYATDAAEAIQENNKSITDKTKNLADSTLKKTKDSKKN